MFVYQIGNQRRKEDTIHTIRQIYTYYKTAGGKGIAEKLKTDKGVKDTFQEFFLDKISSAIKNKRTVSERNEAIVNVSDLPEDPMNPVLRLLGTHSSPEVVLALVKYFSRH